MMAGLSSVRRRRGASLLAAIALVAALWAGCTQVVFEGTPPGTYALSVTGTATSSSATLAHTTTLTLTVN